MTHPYLTDLSAERLHWELQASRRILEAMWMDFERTLDRISSDPGAEWSLVSDLFA